MSSSKTNTFTSKQSPSNSSSSTDIKQRHAQLQAMGITIFEPLHQLDLTQQPWLDSLCKLLNIGFEDCIFDAIQPSFDDKLKKLHLPAFTIASEADIKKRIWQNIRQFAS